MTARTADASPPNAAAEDAAAWPHPRSSWYVVGVLLVGYSLSFADRMMMSLLIAPIKADLHLSDSGVSLLIGFAFATFYVLMGLPFGFLADRLNRRNLIAAGILAWSFATGLCGLATGFGALFLARMAVGAGEAVLAPCAYSLLGDYFPRERLGRAISVYVIGNPLGTGLAMVAGGSLIALVTAAPTVTLPLLGEMTSWRAVFVGLAFPGIALALLVLLTVAEPARRGPARTAKGAGQVTEAFRFIRAHGRTFLFQLSGTSLLSAAVYGTMAWIPAFLTRSHGLPASTIGLWYGLILGVGGVAGLLMSGAWADRLMTRGVIDAYPRVMLYASIAAIVPGIAAPLVPGMTACILLIALNTLATGATIGVSAAAIQFITPPRLRGQMASIYVLLASIAGIGLGPTTVALFTDYVFGQEAALRYSLAIISAVTLPGASICLMLVLPYYRRSAAANESGQPAG